MKVNCFDIGTIQAFLDGEVAQDVALRITEHIGSCAGCSTLLSEAEEESALVFPTLEREFNSLVPTQRLWSRINDSIAVEKENVPFWARGWTALTTLLMNPSLAVAAGILLVFGIFTVYLTSRQQNNPRDQIAIGNTPAPAAVTPAAQPFVDNSLQAPTVAINAPVVRNDRQPTTIKADFRVPSRNAVAIERPGASSGYIPGEESYVKTIANLSQSIAGQKDALMRPSERVSYERDMAVVNDSITKIRNEVRKNPKNESAKQVLYSSYQNKIDLLNSVSQKEELIASLR